MNFLFFIIFQLKKEKNIHRKKILFKFSKFSHKTKQGLHLLYCPSQEKLIISKTNLFFSRRRKALFNHKDPSNIH